MLNVFIEFILNFLFSLLSGAQYIVCKVDKEATMSAVTSLIWPLEYNWYVTEAR